MAISGKFLALSAALLLSLPAAALAQTPAMLQNKICIDPLYIDQWHYLSGLDILATPSMGCELIELKLATTCLGLTWVYDITLHSNFQCIDKGDDVFTSTIDGRHQHCLITHSEPYEPAHPEPQG